MSEERENSLKTKIFCINMFYLTFRCYYGKLMSERLRRLKINNEWCIYITFTQFEYFSCKRPTLFCLPLFQSFTSMIKISILVNDCLTYLLMKVVRICRWTELYLINASQSKTFVRVPSTFAQLLNLAVSTHSTIYLSSPKVLQQKKRGLYWQNVKFAGD